MQTDIKSTFDNYSEQRARLFEQRLEECDSLLDFAIQAAAFRYQRQNPEIREEEILAKIKEWLTTSADLTSDKSQEFRVKNGLA